MSIGYKHLVECHCILPIYKNKTPVVYHKFAVYSKVDKSEKIVPKYVNCNNCGITHYVYEICKSEIKIGKEDITSVRSVEDVKISLPEKLLKILEEYDRGVEDYEFIEDVLDQEIFPSELVINREIIDEEHVVKILNISSNSSFKIKTEKIITIIKESK